MRPLPLSQIARWCEARLIGQDTVVHAVSTDTRTPSSRGLYVALRGERHDGHDFCARAAEHGALALLVSRPVESSLPQLLCGDTALALGELAAGVAQGRRARVIGLTGSNGKTTVKTLLRRIFEQAAPGHAYANPGNRNNEIGLPLAVLDAPEDADYAVYEMGAGKPGDIAYLASIARPSIALVNNVGPAHLERMGSLLGVATTKGALYEALPAHGVAVINADDAFGPYFEQLAGGRTVLRFGIDAGAQVRAADIRRQQAGWRFRLIAPPDEIDITLPLPGRHNLHNALAAAATALAAGVDSSAIAAGLAQAEPVVGRQQVLRLGEEVTLIDDSYNANPASVAAAIDMLAETSGQEAWLVLGDMAELGEGAERLHGQVGARARAAGIGRLFTVGRLSAAASRSFGASGAHFSDQAGLVEALRDALAQRRGGALRVLVKGSRSSAMENVVTALRAGSSGEDRNNVV